MIILNYCLGYLFIYPWLGFIILRIFSVQSENAFIIMQFCIYLMVIIISIILAYPLLKEGYHYWKAHKFFIFKVDISLLVILYFVTIVLSIFIGMFTKTITSNNQVGVSTSIQNFPLLMCFATLVFAPIAEEILFRGIFYRAFRSQFSIFIATFISSFTFGFLHIYDSVISGQWGDCWYILLYAFIGVCLCRSYEKTGTIFGPFLLHFFNNLLAFIMIFL